ncbi:MAG: hypothetical protein K2M17_06320 [Bacilli bacterium]|nr:hypothetical protein [Bacilli bacterium]
MKRNNKLQNLAGQSLSEYHNEEVANELKEIIKLNKQKSATKSSKRKAVFWSSIATAAVAAVVALIIFIPMPNRTSQDRVFGIDNRVTLNADLESLNKDLYHLELGVDSDAFITKTVDTYYNETLYYSIDIGYESGEVLNIFVVTNKDFKLEFNHVYDKKYDDSYKIDIYTLSYSENFELLEPDLYYVETYGELITKNEKLYFSYSGFVSEESSNFMECVQQIITAK